MLVNSSNKKLKIASSSLSQENNIPREQPLVEKKLLPNEFKSCKVPFMFIPHGINDDYNNMIYLPPEDIKAEFINVIEAYLKEEYEDSINDLYASNFIEKIGVNEFDFPETLPISLQLLCYLFEFFFVPLNQKANWYKIDSIKKELDDFKKWLDLWKEFYNYRLNYIENYSDTEDDNNANYSNADDTHNGDDYRGEHYHLHNNDNDDDNNGYNYNNNYKKDKDPQHQPAPIIYFTIVFNLNLNYPELKNYSSSLDYLFYVFPNIEYEFPTGHLQYNLLDMEKITIEYLTKKVQENIHNANLGLDWQKLQTHKKDSLKSQRIFLFDDDDDDNDDDDDDDDNGVGSKRIIQNSKKRSNEFINYHIC